MATSSVTSISLRTCAAAEDGKPGASQPDLPADAGSHTIERLDQLRNSTGGLSVAQIRGQLQKTMQADAAVFRTQARPLTGNLSRIMKASPAYPSPLLQRGPHTGHENSSLPPNAIEEG